MYTYIVAYIHTNMHVYTHLFTHMLTNIHTHYLSIVTLNEKKAVGWRGNSATVLAMTMLEITIIDRNRFTGLWKSYPRKKIMIY